MNIWDNRIDAVRTPGVADGETDASEAVARASGGDAIGKAVGDDEGLTVCTADGEDTTPAGPQAARPIATSMAASQLATQAVRGNRNRPTPSARSRMSPIDVTSASMQAMRVQ